METPEHDAQLDDPTGDVEDNEHDQEDEREESAGAPEAPIGP